MGRMKKLIPSLLLAAVATVLLNLGFVRAAAKWDPTFKPATIVQLDAARPSPDCDSPCACEE